MLAIDAELAAIFTVIVALDAVLTVPANTVLFRRAPFGDWRAGAPTPRSQLQIVSPLSPLFTSIGAPVETATGAQLDHVKERYARAAKTIRALRLIGVAELLLLLIGIPTGVASYAGIGFLVAVAATAAVCSLGAVIAVRQWTVLSGGTRPSMRKILAWCWPFSAPRAAEDVLREVFRGASAPVVARAVLSPAGFNAWIRPWAYDHLVRERKPAIDGLIPASELEALVRHAPQDRDPGAASYCPRCGQSWARPGGHCNGCDVALVALSDTRP
ncbi:MAG TPA: hypothetical protein VJ717_10910 [Gemmatimonadaceae bacterium]|nr:hypothetical protein [Gemmatimonadaceae bacterium]